MGMRDQKGREIPWCYSLYRVAYTIVNGGVDSWQHAQKKEVLNERATADIGNGGSSPTSLLLATAPADGRHNPESKQDIFRFTTCQFASAHAILKRLPRQCFPTQEWDRVTQPRHRRHKTPQIFLSDPTALWDGKSKRERIYLLAHACISIPNPPNVISIKKTRLVCKIRISIQ